MMHPANYMDSIRHEDFETITDLLDLVRNDPNSPLQLVSTRNNPEAQKVVREFDETLARRNECGASALRDGHGWEINSFDGWYILRGKAFPRSERFEKCLETNSPLLLIDRRGGPHKAYYGEDLPALAETVLKNSLAYDALDDARNGKAPLQRDEAPDMDDEDLSHRWDTTDAQPPAHTKSASSLTPLIVIAVIMLVIWWVVSSH